MNLALFDFDGTITEGDTFSPFLRFALGRGRAFIGGVLVSPAVLAYRLGVISASRTRPIVSRVCFQGARAAAVRAIGRRYASEVGDCSGSRKAQRIRERYDLSRYPVIYGYGDTYEDQQMLELAHRKYYRWALVSETSAIARER